MNEDMTAHQEQDGKHANNSCFVATAMNYIPCHGYGNYSKHHPEYLSAVCGRIKKILRQDKGVHGNKSSDDYR